jgi:hypothetical protein
MPDELVGLAAVVLICGIPLMAIIVAYLGKKLRSQERLAAIAKGIPVPEESRVFDPARSRRAGILLVSTAIGIALCFYLIGMKEPDARIVCATALIPLLIGLGFFLDAHLVRRDLRRGEPSRAT